MTVSVGAAQESWMAAAMTILKAAGIEQAEEDETRSTWLEILEQTASSTARHLSGVAPGPVSAAELRRERAGVGRLASRLEGREDFVARRCAGGRCALSACRR